VSDKFEKLPTDGIEVKLTLSSLIYENDIPSSMKDSLEFVSEDSGDDEEYFDEGDGPQKLEQVTVASYSEADGRVTVTYDDSEVLDMPETLTQVTFSVSDPECVSIVRSGALRSMITVEEGKRHVGEYRFGPYSIPVTFYGRRVKNSVKNGVGVIELDYTVEMVGSDASHTKMKLTLEKLPASPMEF
jgi:uncharacterized beta-barrel protein YwiB (DUF1934 family)